MPVINIRLILVIRPIPAIWITLITLQFKEGVMVEVTEAASQQIADYFKDREVAPIRIFLNDGGWGGPSLAMALDEPKETDNVYDVNGFQFIMDKDFDEKAKPVTVDFLGYGFKISSSIEFGQGSACSSCGSGSGCG